MNCQKAKPHNASIKRQTVVYPLAACLVISLLFSTCLRKGGTHIEFSKIFKPESSERQSPVQDIYYRPYENVWDAVIKLFKKDHIAYEVDLTSGTISANDIGQVTVKKLGGCKTEISFSPNKSKDHPLQKSFFVALDAALADAPPQQTPFAAEVRSRERENSDSVAVSFPKKLMIVNTRSGSGGNVRSTPWKENGNIIVSLPRGSEVTAYEKKGKWYHIVFGDNRKGWAHEIILAEKDKKREEGATSPALNKTPTGPERETEKPITEMQPSIRLVNTPSRPDSVKREIELQTEENQMSVTFFRWVIYAAFLA